jgi:hypothetical protein
VELKILSTKKPSIPKKYNDIENAKKDKRTENQPIIYEKRFDREQI